MPCCVLILQICESRTITHWSRFSDWLTDPLKQHVCLLLFLHDYKMCCAMILRSFSTTLQTPVAFLEIGVSRKSLLPLSWMWDDFGQTYFQSKHYIATLACGDSAKIWGWGSKQSNHAGLLVVTAWERHCQKTPCKHNTVLSNVTHIEQCCSLNLFEGWLSKSLMTFWLLCSNQGEAHNTNPATVFWDLLADDKRYKQVNLWKPSCCDRYFLKQQTTWPSQAVQAALKTEAWANNKILSQASAAANKMRTRPSTKQHSMYDSKHA